MPIIPPIMLAKEPPKPKLAAIAVREPIENFTIEPKKTRIEESSLSIIALGINYALYNINVFVCQMIQNFGGISFLK
jgi:hypothetical protein